MPTYFNFNESPATFEFHPEDLMYAGEGSVWWDFGDETVMFKDIAQSEPVTASGDKVALVLDKGPDGIFLFNTDATRLPTFIIDGDKKFLRFDAANFEYLATADDVQLALNSCYGFTAFSTASPADYQRVLAVGKAGVNDGQGTGTLTVTSGSVSTMFGVRTRDGQIDTYFSGAGSTPLGRYEYSIKGINSAKVWKDGVAGVSDTSHGVMDAKTLGRVCVGAAVTNNNVSKSACLNGDHYGIMHFATDLAPGDISALRTWWNLNRL